MSIIPQFFCFRYKGLKKPADVIAASAKNGWNFRKWQNWKQVHIEASDKMLLKKSGDSLVEDGKFDVKDFGRLSEILLKVQCWRKDRENLSFPPDSLPAWDESNELLKVCVSNPAAVAVKMHRDLTGIDEIPPVQLLDVFYWHLLAQYFEKLKHPDSAQMSFAPPWHLNKLGNAVFETIEKLYLSVGLPVPSFSADEFHRKLVSRCYDDLGFPTPDFKLKVPWEMGPRDSAVKCSLISYESLGPVDLLRISQRESTVVVRINKDHALLKNIDSLSSKAVLEVLLTAYAESVASLPSKQNELEQLSTLFSLKTKQLVVSNH